MKKSFIVLSSILLAVPVFAQSGAQSSTTQNPNTQSTNSQNTNQQSTNQNQNTNPNQNQVQSPMANQQSQANQKQGLSSLAARLINNTTEARDAIRQQDQKGALMYIGRASEDLSQLRKYDPNNKMIPIFTEVSDVWVVGTVRNRAAATADQTGQDQSTSNQPGANNAKGSNAMGNSTTNGRGVAVRDIRGQFTAVFLDTAGGTAHLQAAHQAVENGNYPLADQALAAMQDSLIAASVKGDMPLMKAREDLILARGAAKSGDQMEERAALQASSNALAEYANNGGSHAQPAAYVSQQIRHDCGSQVSSQQINVWWGQVSDWTQPGPPQG